LQFECIGLSNIDSVVTFKKSAQTIQNLEKLLFRSIFADN